MAAVAIGCDAAFSYVSTRNLAERLGLGSLSWLFPLCLDATAAVGMELWLSRSPAQREAKWLALSAIAMSLAANFFDWWLAQDNWRPAVLGAVPPAMLAAQLLVLHKHGSRPPRRPHTVRTAPHRAPGPKPQVSDADLPTKMRQHETTNGRLTKRQVMRQYRVGDGRALRLLDRLHTHEPSSTNGAVVH
jgi:hypothetical protein